MNVIKSSRTTYEVNLKVIVTEDESDIMLVEVYDEGKLIKQWTDTPTQQQFGPIANFVKSFLMKGQI